MPSYIIAERRKGSITRETYELLGFARKIGKGEKPVLILPGKDVVQAAKEISNETGCDTIALCGDHLERYDSQTYAHSIMEILGKEESAWVCLPHTSTGFDLAPRLAVKLKAACITAVAAVGEGWLSRPVYSGKFREEIVPKTPVVVVTVLPGAFQPSDEGPGSSGRVRVVQAAKRAVPSQALGTSESGHGDSSLRDAEVIISGGRGIGRKENIALLKELAGFFPRSALGASRSACDMGWFEHKHQIGTTGETVSPRLYIACGISGAFQHVSGIRASQNIVAINTDPRAAIFQVAHYCVVEDLAKFLPILIEELRQERMSNVEHRTVES